MSFVTARNFSNQYFSRAGRTFALAVLHEIDSPSRIFHEVLATIATDWRGCDSDDALCNMINVAGVSNRFSNLIVGLHSMAVLFYGIGVVALHSGCLLYTS